MGDIASELHTEVGDFELHFKHDRRLGEDALMLRSKSAGKHFAVHTRFNLLDDNGNIIEARPITAEVARFIIDNFEKRGDTMSFDIYRSDLDAGAVQSRDTMGADPGDVRHTLTSTEHSFTSTGRKLNHHWPIFKKYRDTGYGSIIRATLTLHQVCSSHCHYCSTIARNRKDSISLDEAKAFVMALYEDQAAYNREHFPEYNDAYCKLTGSDIRLRGIILSGGGQPNLWPHFEEFVHWLSERDIDLGLITNGFPQKVSDDVYGKFKWVRISITPEDASPHYVDGRFDLQRIPDVLKHNDDVTVGYSYVYGPWTDDGILSRIDAALEDNGFTYCRMLTDCNLSRSAQIRAHQALAERLFRQGFVDENGNPLRKLFHQLKYHGTPGEAEKLWDDGQCFLQTYNVFWDTTGHEQNGHSYCYACDSITVLAEEQTDTSVHVSERRFNHEKWGTVKNTEVERLYNEKVQAFFDPRKTCSACLFMRNNIEVKNLSKRETYDETAVSSDIEHVNFP